MVRSMVWVWGEVCIFDKIRDYFNVLSGEHLSCRE